MLFDNLSPTHIFFILVFYILIWVDRTMVNYQDMFCKSITKRCLFIVPRLFIYMVFCLYIMFVIHLAVGRFDSIDSYVIYSVPSLCVLLHLPSAKKKYVHSLRCIRNSALIKKIGAAKQSQNEELIQQAYEAKYQFAYELKCCNDEASVKFATTLFRDLGKYKDSKEQVVECERLYWELFESRWDKIDFWYNLILFRLLPIGAIAWAIIYLFFLRN